MENNKDILVSIAIATFNRSELLDKVLFSLVNQTVKKIYYEILICDSKSSDSTIDVVEKYKSQSIYIRHYHTKNILAAKRNIGIRNAIGNLVVFLDDDCVPERSFVEKYFLIAKSKNFDLDKSVYCGHVLFPEDWVKKSNYYKYRDSRHYNIRNHKKISRLDYRTIIVMNMGFNRELFVRYISEVNENFIGYGYEDQELGWRLEISGFEIKLHDACVTHFEKSGDIVGYGKKIYYSAKDGMNNLLKYSEEAAKNLGFNTYVLDPDLKHKWRVITILKRSISQLLFNKYISNILIYFLKVTDGISFFYSPFFYRYVLAYYYIQGAKARRITKKNIGWYD